MARVFVIRPFGKKIDSAGKMFDFDGVHNNLIQPAIEASDHEFSGDTTAEIIEAGNIREDMFALILEADLVISDITIHNANVFYELGIRHALRKRRTILIKGSPTEDSTPFDLSTDRYLSYDTSKPGDTLVALTEMINKTLKSDRETDSPVFQLLPLLPEVDLNRVQVVPPDFREEVDRARNSRSVGWLRLLRQEVKNERFQWGGLRTVGKAQWDLRDYEGASDTWETILNLHRDDVEANLALANVYERLYTETKNEDWLKKSDQAIERVKNKNSLTNDALAEALSLEGRNQKTRWKIEFQHLNTAEERRAKAMNKALRGSYEAYRDVFMTDLNMFWPGLVALQMGMILLDFSKSEHWSDAFHTDQLAEDYKQELDECVERLLAVVPISTAAAVAKIPKNHPDRYWAEISEADVLFLTSDKSPRVIMAYEHAVPTDKPFAWDAARGQLQLFADLGVKKDLANAVMDTIDLQFLDQKEPSSAKPRHLIVFAGHRIDEANRAHPRFPAAQESRAREFIANKLKDLLGEDEEFFALASAAPGADILFHEVCAELGVESTVCLPMPSSDFARMAFDNLDAWRNRYLKLERNNRNFLELSDRNGLPRWLKSTDPNPWERGNEWVYQMAVSQSAKRITLVALWDRDKQGDARGGCAHMVQLAQDSGKFFIEILDSKCLLEPISA